MTFEAFTDLAAQLPEQRWSDMLEKNKATMIKKPVAEWPRHLEKLISEVSELKTDAVTR